VRWWKLLGLAGLVGVAATGAVIARDQRTRAAYQPDEIRDRLRERLGQEPATPTSETPAPTETPAPEA
jgi:hypothetical protein